MTAKLYPLVDRPARGDLRLVRSQAAAARCARSACSRPSPCSSSCRSRILSPGGLWDSFHSQSARGLQIESLGASISCSRRDQLGLYARDGRARRDRSRDRDLAGSLPDALATITTLLQAVAVAAVWWLLRARLPRA